MNTTKLDISNPKLNPEPGTILYGGTADDYRCYIVVRLRESSLYNLVSINDGGEFFNRWYTKDDFYHHLNNYKLRALPKHSTVSIVV